VIRNSAGCKRTTGRESWNGLTGRQLR